MTDQQFIQRQRLAKKFRLSLIKRATPSELAIKSQLSRMGIHFIFQKVFIKEVGMFVADFYFPKRRLVIEVDGMSHFGKVNRKDIDKNEYFTLNRGLSVIRITNTEAKTIRDPDLYHLISTIGVREVRYSVGYSQPHNRKR